MDFEYQYDSIEHEIEVLGDCQLSGEYDVTITATKLRLSFYNEYYSKISYEFTRVQ